MNSRAKKMIGMVTSTNHTNTRPIVSNGLDEQLNSSDTNRPIVSNGLDEKLNSSDTNSIPDSEPAFDMSFLEESGDTFLKNYRQAIGPNIVVSESDDDSDSDSSASTSSSSSESSKRDYSSDDSAKDPDYQYATDSDSDRNDSPKAGCSGLQNVKKTKKTNDRSPSRSPQTNVWFQPPASDKPIVTDSQYHNVQTESAAAHTQPLDIYSAPSSVNAEPPSVLSEPPSVCVDSPNVAASSRGKKRKANREEWQRNKSKLLKNCGQAYTSMSKTKKVFEEKKMKPACHDQCKFKCTAAFLNEDRLNIFRSYWALGNIESQRQFIQNSMTKVETKYRYTREGSNRINMNNAYHFLLNDERIRVCKLFFMNTLSVSDKTIRTVVKKTSKLTGIQLKDERGKHGNHKKLDPSLIEGVKSHINSIARIESHHCRPQTSREFIEGGLCVASMHREYVGQCKANGVAYVSYQIYYNIFVNEFNISFFKPKKDQCKECTVYENADAEEKEALQDNFDLHITEKSLARDEKNSDKENVSSTYIVSVYDLQAVMPCPQGEVSCFYYLSKLNLLNFTITELGTKRTDCYVWHEGEGARGVNEIGSCVLTYLKNLNDNATEDLDVGFYSDNCCGQQKNKYMLAMYQYAINEYSKIRSITHKFLITGHTQNEGDSVHSTIQQNISRALKSSPIYVPEQYITLIKTAKKQGDPYNVFELTHEDFWNIKSLADGKYTVTEDGERILWADIKVMKTIREEKHKVFIKTSYTEDNFKSVSTLKRGQKKSVRNSIQLKRLYNQRLKVSETKICGILNLIHQKVIPRYYKSFYESLLIE